MRKITSVVASAARKTKSDLSCQFTRWLLTLQYGLGSVILACERRLYNVKACYPDECNALFPLYLTGGRNTPFTTFPSGNDAGKIFGTDCDCNDCMNCSILVKKCH